MSAQRILLTGPPGCGKTTVIRRTIERLPGLKIAGFYTQETRAGGVRTGFEVIGLSTGRTVPLASVGTESRVRVGRYGVELEGFEAILLDEFGGVVRKADLLVIDEIGKMECASSLFVQIVRDAFDRGVPLLGTVAQKGEGLIREIKSRQDAEVLTVTSENRDRLPRQLAERFRDGHPG